MRSVALGIRFNSCARIYSVERIISSNKLATAFSFKSREQGEDGFGRHLRRQFSIEVEGLEIRYVILKQESGWIRSLAVRFLPAQLLASR